MFERFTERARRVVVLAQEEARGLDHNYIGTEHLLLGLLAEGDGVAAQALDRLGVSLMPVRAEIQRIIGRGDTTPSGHIPFTPRAKKVLELSLREALALRHSYIGTEHILLGLLREGEGVAAQVLTKFGADLARVRQQVQQILYAHGEPSERPLWSTNAPSLGARHAREENAWPPRLVRVVPLGTEVELSQGRRLVLLSLDIWSDWVDLRAALASSEERNPPALGTPASDAWQLADDLDTAYRRLGISIYGDDLFQVHQATFAPAPPPEAKRLTLRLPAPAEAEENEIQVVVELAA